MHDFNLEPTAKQYISVGQLCQFLQVLPGQLEVLMQAASIEQFDMALDGVCYLTADNAELVFEECRKVREEIESVSESTKWN